MNHESLSELIASMIAAGRVPCTPARTPWPLHAALWQLNEEAGRLGLRSKLNARLTFSPSSEVGWRAEGADSALRDLVRAGLIREAGSGLNACLLVNEEQLVERRRRLLALEPEIVRLIQGAGERWAAFAATCSKYLETSAVASELMVASGTA
jgi:hypothetical protein